MQDTSIIWQFLCQRFFIFVPVLKHKTKLLMKVVLFDDESWGTLRPLTFTRPIAELRVGILTIREKWEKRLNCQVSFLTEDYLQEKYPMVL